MRFFNCRKICDSSTCVENAQVQCLFKYDNKSMCAKNAHLREIRINIYRGANISPRYMIYSNLAEKKS